MPKLSISSNSKETHIFLDGFEVTNIINYEVKSSTTGMAELTLKVLVCVSELNVSNEITDNFCGNLSKNVQRV